MPGEEGGAGLERLLDAAESLFIERGYSAIKLKHIADRIGVKESSIYYHFPKGKEALFIAVMRRHFQRHRVGMEWAIARAGEDWVDQLRAAAHWLISQPALDLMRMSQADLPAIDPTSASELEEAIYEALHLPIRQVLESAVAAQRANIPDTDLIAGVFIAMVSSVHLIKGAWNPRSPAEMVDLLLESWVNGLRRA